MELERQQKETQIALEQLRKLNENERIERERKEHERETTRIQEERELRQAQLNQQNEFNMKLLSTMALSLRPASTFEAEQK